MPQGQGQRARRDRGPTAPGPCPVTILTPRPSPVVWDHLPQRRMLWVEPPLVCVCVHTRVHVCDHMLVHREGRRVDSEGCRGMCVGGVSPVRCMGISRGLGGSGIWGG